MNIEKSVNPPDCAWIGEGTAYDNGGLKATLPKATRKNGIEDGTRFNVYKHPLGILLIPKEA